MPEESKVGIDAIKNVIGGSYHLTIRVIEVTKPESSGGSKVTFPEIIGSAGVVYDLVAAVMNAKKAYEELVDMDEAEENELLLWAENEFEIAKDKVKAFVIQMIRTLMEIAEGVLMISTLKEAK